MLRAVLRSNLPYLRAISDARVDQQYIVRLTGGNRGVTVGDIATINDTLEDEQSRSWVGGKRALVFQVYRQSGANTVRVAQDVVKQLGRLNERFKDMKGTPHLDVVNDRSRVINANVDDVYESILIGIVLTVIVVYFFLGSALDDHHRTRFAELSSGRRDFDGLGWLFDQYHVALGIKSRGRSFDRRCHCRAREHHPGKSKRGWGRSRARSREPKR